MIKRDANSSFYIQPADIYTAMHVEPRWRYRGLYHRSEDMLGKRKKTVCMVIYGHITALNCFGEWSRCNNESDGAYSTLWLSDPASPPVNVPVLIEGSSAMSSANSSRTSLGTVLS